MILSLEDPRSHDFSLRRLPEHRLVDKNDSLSHEHHMPQPGPAPPLDAHSARTVS